MVRHESCMEEENTADIQALESPDYAGSVVEINVVQSVEDIGEDLTKGGKKTEVEESAVDMKDTQRTPSIEMEPESQSETQSNVLKPVKSLDEEPMREMSAAVEDEDNTSEVDLYRDAEEIEEDQLEKNGAKCVDDLIVPHDKCSICPELDMLSYSENEWRGKTAKSALIKKGYEEVYTNFSGLRRVRGDNYCAMRATLFQVLIQSKETPAWLQREDFIQLPEKLASCYDWMKQWRFTQDNENGRLVELLRGHMQLLKRKWLTVVESSSAEERQAVCEEIFRNEEEEYSLLEAVKLLMLNTAIELHNDMQLDKDVPIFCWLLFARDSSDTPSAFLSNHLNQVGFSGGLEQVEMFLLGYTLELTIRVYRLYKFETDEFLTFYPDDHKEDWPAVCLITEDDRHYNVPVQKQDTTRL
ncbi:ubiquitin thioesterase otulin-like [Polyodon spathula]|uniref:ubiquitin thioesterase otulin-like n=1 Tax=Polyodon spathula TaxID=7913 RepID=UPI001B7E04F7|nr:ubiquitin thioesterase otulin-like [Polyodon spathula]XP_041103144.1 ubiquitin thioesterase otulin-like [Polyodon spathula]